MRALANDLAGCGEAEGFSFMAPGSRLTTEAGHVVTVTHVIIATHALDTNVFRGGVCFSNQLQKGGEMRRAVFVVAVALVAVLAGAGLASADVRITDQTYVRHDGGTDVTIASCSSDFSDPALDAPTPTPPTDEGGGERQQNEPTAAVNPLAPTKMTAGANDYCPVTTTTDAWAGFYYSSNTGATWTNSLLPGYPTDTSAEGQASPLHGLVTSAGDPVQDWDRANHLYYGGIAFNRSKPANGSIWVARYNWSAPFVAPDYEYTSIVARGTPSPIFVGHFEDKVELEVDDGVNSPFAGNVYVCWARFTGSGANNFIEFARSTDGGRTWQTPEDLRVDPRQPRVRHRRHQDGDRLRDLAPVRVLGRPGASAGGRYRLGQVARWRGHVHEAGDRPGVHSLGHDRPCRLAGGNGTGPLRVVLGG